MLGDVSGLANSMGYPFGKRLLTKCLNAFKNMKIPYFPEILLNPVE